MTTPERRNGKLTPELEQRECEDLEQIMHEALLKAYQHHIALGHSGTEKIEKNQFGETALRADIEAEQQVIETFRAHQLPIVVISEEHGTVDLAQEFGQPARYTAILDGLDGSSLYSKDTRARYGTMLGVYRGTDPRYADYISGGIMEPSTKRLFAATRNKGACVIDAETKQRQPIHAATAQRLDPSSTPLIYVNNWFDINVRTIGDPLVASGFSHVCKDSTAVHFADVANGSALAAIECTRKGNLEFAAAYPLLHEAGGVMFDLQGNDIGSRHYLSYAQQPDDRVIIITAANRAIADQIIQLV